VSLNRGKRKRRGRRRFGGDPVGQDQDSFEETASPAAPKAKRRTKPLAERSPITPAVFAVICVLGSAYTLFFVPNSKIVHGKPVPTGASTFEIVTGIVYFVLALVEAYIAYRIYRARGGSWR